MVQNQEPVHTQARRKCALYAWQCKVARCIVFGYDENANLGCSGKKHSAAYRSPFVQETLVCACRKVTEFYPYSALGLYLSPILLKISRRKRDTEMLTE